MDYNQEFDDYTEPLSPVLNSSKNRKKFRKKLLENKANVRTKLFETKHITEKEIKTSCISSPVNEPDQKVEADLKRGAQFATNSKMVSSTFGFETASGKKLFSKNTSSDYANQLFVDIFDSTSSHKRKHKYNFLSSKISNVSPEDSKGVDFLGFDEEEYISSLKKFENLQNLFKTLLEQLQNIDEFYKKGSLDEFNLLKPNEKRKLNLRSNEFQIRKQKILRTNIRSQNNCLNDYANEVSYAANFKNVQESSQKVDRDSLSFSSIGTNSDAYQMHTKIIEKIDLNSEHSVISENLYNLSNTQSITDKKIYSKSTSSELASSVETLDNVEIFQEKKNIVLKENNSAYGSDIPSGNIKTSDFQYLTRYNDKSNSDNLSFDHAQTKFDSMIHFSTASGKKISVSNAALSRANCVFKDTQDIELLEESSTSFIKKNLLSPVKSQPEFGKQKVDLGKLNQAAVNAEKRSNLIEKTNNSIPDSLLSRTNECSNVGFSTASGKGIKIASNSLAKLNHIFKDITDIDDLTKNNFSNATNYTAPSNEIVNNKLSNMKTEDSFNSSNSEMDNFLTPVRDNSSKRRLGRSVCKKGKLSDVALNRAKSLFSDMNFDDLKLPKHIKQIASPSTLTPIRSNRTVLTPQYATNYISTPTPHLSLFSDMNFDDLKLPEHLKKITGPSTFTPIQSSRTALTPQYATNYISTPSSQLRKSTFDKNELFLSDLPQEYNCPLLIQKPTTGDLISWDDELQKQEEILRKKLTMITKKREALSNQIQASSMNEANKQTPSLPKKIIKVKLKDVQRLEMQSDNLEKVNNVILQINPQNAVLIHFNGKWLDSATVTTEEGCIVIPTQQGLIGLSEIAPAFCTLPDIKKSLIPEGWMRNHYKWIIWKLASYERFFPSTLGGCFTVENVIKQLKYRYYRELYCAERPALRKIYEMDDIPQRRMVLCISNIFKNGDNIELELTDGWYSIRTLIDEPLCHQVTKKKIRIGSKLITSGAELINCEGCYPLELEAQKVRLKIHFNSTRRVSWSSKLGYQKNSMPFLIRINDAHTAGGVIGVVKMYIVRAYPLIYREKTNHSFVWRNQNAENKMIQEYEKKSFKDYEDSSSNNKAITYRNVSPVLQMTVVDVLGKKPKPFKCTVWDATEFHIQQLKENQIIMMYNLTLRSTDELCCNNRTRYELSKDNPVEYVKYKRRYVAIDDYDVMLSNSSFELFDTIGFVVELFEGEENQYFWLTGINRSLLLIEINEGPNTCLLLNRIQKDQPVAVCNLSLKDGCEGYVGATAGLNTVVTHYPQYEYIRNELDKVKKQNKTELDMLLKSAKIKLSTLQEKNAVKHTPHSSSNTLDFSRVNSTDIVMSMINIDNVVNNVK